MQTLKDLRIKKGVTQEYMADFLGITRPTYTRYESGERNPDYDTLVKLSEFFEVTTDYLLGREEIRVALSSPTGYDDLSESDKAMIDDMIRLALERKKNM